MNSSIIEVSLEDLGHRLLGPKSGETVDRTHRLAKICLEKLGDGYEVTPSEDKRWLRRPGRRKNHSIEPLIIKLARLRKLDWEKETKTEWLRAYYHSAYAKLNKDRKPTVPLEKCIELMNDLTNEDDPWRNITYFCYGLFLPDLDSLTAATSSGLLTWS